MAVFANLNASRENQKWVAHYTEVFLEKRAERRQGKGERIRDSKGRLNHKPGALRLSFPSRSLPLLFYSFLSLLTSSGFPLWFFPVTPFPFRCKTILPPSLPSLGDPLFLLFSRRRVVAAPRTAPYYSSYVNEFRLIIWERSRTENDRNEKVRGV